MAAKRGYDLEFNGRECASPDLPRPFPYAVDAESFDVAQRELGNSTTLNVRLVVQRSVPLP